jgi:hypothetical protein
MPKKHTISNKTRKRPGRDLDQIQEDISKPEKVSHLSYIKYINTKNECNYQIIHSPLIHRWPG